MNEWITEVDLEYPQKLHDSQNLYFSRYALKLLWEKKQERNTK